jgi:hypothetical protein
LLTVAGLAAPAVEAAADAGNPGFGDTACPMVESESEVAGRTTWDAGGEECASLATWAVAKLQSVASVKTPQK